MTTPRTYSTRIASALGVCLIACMCTMSAQISQQTNSLEFGKPTVRDLVKNSHARFSVVRKSVETGVMKATVVLSDVDNKSIGGYGAPYIESNEQMLALWRDFIVANLNMPANPDEITVTENRISPDTSFAVGFVLDHSPSTTLPRAIRMQRAVQTALKQFESRDFVSVVKFTGRVNVEVPATKDKEEYTSKFQVNGLNMRVSGSSVFDATYRGIEEIAETHTGRRLLILFTDGEDNSSSKTMEEVVALAKASNCVIHTVTYGVGDDDVLDGLATGTGGSKHQINDVHDFDRIFLGIYASMRHSYDIVVRVSNKTQLTSNTNSNSIISSSVAARGTIQPMEVLTMLPKRGVQVSNTSLRTDQSLTLNVDLKFEGEASEINAADLLMLDSIATVLVQRADLALEIVPGTSDATMAPEDVVIAQRRATAVRDLLIRRGVHPSRVQGFASRPSSTPQPRGTSPKTTFVFTKM